MAINFHNSLPILRVNDLVASLKYYQEILGFKLDWDYDKVVASVSRGECNIMLAQGDQGKGNAWTYVGVGDVHQLHEEFEKSGAKVRQKPTNFSWACEIQIEDLDGNVIRFGSDPSEEIPYGPWLDAEGKSWNMINEQSSNGH